MLISECYAFSIAFLILNPSNYVLRIPALVHRSFVLSSTSLRPSEVELPPPTPKLVNLLINSPLFKPIVSIARRSMVSTATNAGVDWTGNVDNLLNKSGINWQENVQNIIDENKELYENIPSYYKNSFHGYEEGNLCLLAAVEQEVAGYAVGIRNFPKEGTS